MNELQIIKEAPASQDFSIVQFKNDPAEFKINEQPGFETQQRLHDCEDKSHKNPNQKKDSSRKIARPASKSRAKNPKGSSRKSAAKRPGQIWGENGARVVDHSYFQIEQEGSNIQDGSDLEEDDDG